MKIVENRFCWGDAKLCSFSAFWLVSAARVIIGQRTLSCDWPREALQRFGATYKLDHKNLFLVFKYCSYDFCGLDLNSQLCVSSKFGASTLCLFHNLLYRRRTAIFDLTSGRNVRVTSHVALYDRDEWTKRIFNKHSYFWMWLFSETSKRTSCWVRQYNSSNFQAHWPKHQTGLSY